MDAKDSYLPEFYLYSEFKGKNRMSHRPDRVANPGEDQLVLETSSTLIFDDCSE